MLKIEDVEVMGMRKAIKGMRNPLNSWDKNDSRYAVDEKPDGVEFSYFKIGEKDMKLCKNLVKAGNADRKFLRMIHVQANVTAPLYWWKEYDTYKVGTVANSCSTMHTIHKKEFTLDDFSHEHLLEDGKLKIYPNRGYGPYCGDLDSNYILELIIELLNKARELYLETKDKTYWWQMIQLLPSSFNQMRTIDLNYETLLSIYHQRKNHKLNEWVVFCEWIKTLPYMEEFIND